MAKSEKQTSLPFNLAGDGLASDQPVSLRLTGNKPARSLTRNQKKFGQLLKEVEKLRARQQRTTTTWETFLAGYLARIHPEEQRQHELRKTLVSQLASHLHHPKGLGPRQRDALADIIELQLDIILNHEPDLTDPELVALIKHFEQRALSDDDTDGLDDLPAFMSKIIQKAELDPAGFHAGMDEAAFMQEVERQLGLDSDFSRFETNPDPDEAPPPPPSRKRKGKAAAKPDPRAQAEEARKRTISTIYKQLAKVLHPDLETDPAQREQKLHLMQELTTAYRAGDLHTLLRLELSWIHREEGDLDRLTDEKLKVYIELLNEQVAELKQEVISIPYSSRFASVSRFASPFTHEPDDLEYILDSLAPLTQSLAGTLKNLAGPQARTELREMIKAHIAHQKARSRLPSFDPFEF